MDSAYLENYSWIYVHTNDLDQGIVVEWTPSLNFKYHKSRTQAIKFEII